MIDEIEEFFERGCGRCPRFSTPACSAMLWNAGLRDLRRIVLAAGPQETVKWGHACYMHAGRNIAIIGAFQGDFRLSFFNAALMTDPEGVLQRQGPNTRHPDMIRFGDHAGPAQREPVIRAYLAEAMGYAEDGVVPAAEPREVQWPRELTEALAADTELAEAFHALTPGRQRSYLHNLNTAKASSTRIARIERFRDRILAGKGATER